MNGRAVRSSKEPTNNLVSLATETAITTACVGTNDREIMHVVWFYF